MKITRHTNATKMWNRWNILFLLLEFLTIIIIISVFIIKNSIQNPVIIRRSENLEPNDVTTQFSEKYITCNPIGSPFGCGGMGNHLYRFASLYGIAKALNRTPYYDTYYECVARLYKEIQDTFPNYKKFLRLERRNIHEKTIVDFGQHCCRYDNPERLKSINAPYIELTGIHLQSYKFFEKVFDEVREMFSFSDPVKRAVDSARNKLFGNDTNHKLCVHTRRGDFANTNTESKGQFTEEATVYAASFLQKKFDNISVILLGKDKPFLRSINLTRESIHISSVYIPDEMKRMEDLCFMASSCDSFIITAAHSTFSWWGAFLMKSGWNQPFANNTMNSDTAGGHVFYDSDFSFGGDLHDYSNFLPEWIPLRFVNNSVVAV